MNNFQFQYSAKSVPKLEKNSIYDWFLILLLGRFVLKRTINCSASLCIVFFVLCCQSTLTPSDKIGNLYAILAQIALNLTIKTKFTRKTAQNSELFVTFAVKLRNIRYGTRIANQELPILQRRNYY